MINQDIRVKYASKMLGGIATDAVATNNGKMY
jgi:hypothetical protein